MVIQCGNGNCKKKARVNEDNLNAAMPIVVCPHCGAKNRIPSAVPKPNPNNGAPTDKGKTVPIFNNAESSQASSPQSSNPQELGWIIIHDENVKTKTYPLSMGKNVIGRNSDSTVAEVTLRVDTMDNYMSRNHCVLDVSKNKNGTYDYVLSDRKSLNRTFVNGKSVAISTQDEVYLRDADCIQIGRTKVILKTLKVAGNAQKAKSSVTEMEYTQTIINK
jgi:pSer/pThr/pTyr-binding forkhead associated (FHA) protein